MPKITTRGGDTYVKDLGGNGRPLVALHGGLGLEHGYLRPSFDSFADEFRVIYIDFLGNGRSDRTIDYASITDNQIWVDQVEDVIAQLNLESPIIAGHSYGGYVAQEFAIQHDVPDLELILITTAPKFDHLDLAVANARARGTEDQIKAVEEDLAHPQGTDQEWATTWRRLLPLYFHAPDDAVIDGIVEGAIFSAEGFNTTHLRALKNFDTSAQLADIQARTLVVSGDDDWILPLDPCSLALANGILGADLAVIPACGHFPFIEKTNEFNTLVRGWLHG
jgi:proline iminopeptidase